MDGRSSIKNNIQTNDTSEIVKAVLETLVTFIDPMLTERVRVMHEKRE